jgi:two-component system chemotaxis response regulator CheY
MAKTALIVDDSVSMRKMVAFTLRQAGFDVVEGENGQDALTRMAGRKIEIIVTDLNMPVMDGFTFIRAVRRRPDSRFTPILMLTTESQGDKKQEGRAAGATGWIVKPFDSQKLLDTIARVLL